MFVDLWDVEEIMDVRSTFKNGLKHKLWTNECDKKGVYLVDISSSPLYDLFNGSKFKLLLPSHPSNILF